MATEPSYAAWRALVDEGLQGADFERRLVQSTLDGLALQPLYDASMPEAAALDALPGHGASARGAAPLGIHAGWQVAVEPTPCVASRWLQRAHDELDGGASAIVVRMHDRVAGRPAGTHTGGLVPTTADELVQTVRAVDTRGAAIDLDAGLRTSVFVDALRDAVPDGGFTGGLRIAFDPWAEAARWGDAALAEPALAAAPALAEWAFGEAAHLTPFVVSTRIWHEAGASLIDETAMALASMVDLLRRLDDSGVAPDEAAGLFAFEATVGRDLLVEAARLRAVRALWSAILDACGVDPSLRGLSVVARTSRRTLTRRDPWTNLLRGTTGALAAVLGGAGRVLVEPFDAALGAPGELGRRMSRNTQLVLQYETHLHRVVDPLGGSYTAEALTRQLIETVGERFRAVEAAGGIEAVVRSGEAARRIEAANQGRARWLASRKMPVLGVSEFPLLDERPPTLDARDDDAALQGLEVAAPVWSAPIQDRTPALPLHRDAAAWERVRDRADAVRTRSGDPTVFIATLGALAEHNARTTWLANLLAAGGMPTALPEGAENPATEPAATIPALVDAWRSTGHRAVVLSAPDALYDAHGAELVRALRAAGAAFVGVAGKTRPAFDAAPVDLFLWAGCDALAAVTRLLDATEA